jgi:hypothetical protein
VQIETPGLRDRADPIRRNGNRPDRQQAYFVFARGVLLFFAIDHCCNAVLNLLSEGLSLVCQRGFKYSMLSFFCVVEPTHVGLYPRA